MLRSLFSGVSGMKNNQIKMDVIGNNIANVNTTAFKSGRVRFQDILSQTIKDGSSPTVDGRGGINPRQVGLGMGIAGIDTIVNTGSLQPTGRPLDCAVDGEGYYVLSDGIRTVYSRDGAFNFDSDFNIVNSDGLKLMGYAPQDPGFDTSTLVSLSIPPEHPDDADVMINNFSIEANGVIKGVYEDGSIVELGKIALAKFANPAGLTKLGGNNYTVSANSGIAEIGEASIDGFGDIQQSTLEMSNVDLASEFTDMIITSRAFQANSRTITTSDEMLQELLNLKR